MCTTFTYRTKDGTILVGRNFDWFMEGGNIHMVPPSKSYGINSYGHFMIEQVGKDKPYDGVNEKGLFIAGNAVPRTKPSKKKKDMTFLGAVRYILQRAETAEEAMDIIKRLSIDYMAYDGFPKVQYMFSDRNGTVGIYEEDKVEKIIQLGMAEGVVVTNFSLSNPKKCERHGIVEETIRIGIEDSEACMTLLKRVHQAREVEKKPFTIYSTVYNLSEGSIEHKIEKEGQIHQYNLDELANGYSNDAFVTLKTRSFRKSRI